MKTPRLVVKELAGSLHVSTRYVYEMRRCGFPMVGTHFRQAATPKEAVDWIRKNDFRMVNGYGTVRKSAKCDS